MKKLKYILIMFVAVMMTVSCSNDDDNDGVDSGDSALVGTWGISEAIEGLEISLKVTFNANATGKIISVFTMGGESQTESDDFTWSTDGNKLTMVIAGETDVSTYSISGNKLTITQDGDNTVFTKQ
jgi:hypothetical protein